ncbi:acetyl-CoA synthetase alpha and beta chains [Desulfocucumis palustris]|uniref:Acetyl-CoA synthetase alpha and beta chains n=1 Tax=Desulfocucumis palustris TaxID=1898651 RepID=A0A2L2X9Q9_9FIRM|nr:acetate--CoA ligase [Desulfocucumis palustris]GBF32935.1 acetyl-CoA synthetase alpha and beta chains [Desulfocucumis palustris]
MGVLSNFFSPKSVAIVGASNSPGKIGHAIVKNVMESGYTGKILPVNPKEQEIMGLQAFPGIKDISEEVEMAVISVPAARVLNVAKECGKAGVKNLVVITAGFKEVGKEGLDMEKQLLATCREYGMHMLGPNCLGMMDTHMQLNTSFAKVFPIKGNIAFFSQSGAMMVAILDWSRSVGLGFSKVVSLGNKADLSEIDFIEEAAEDPYTRVILCYIEDVSDGKRFLEVVGNATRKKPVIILKSGTSQAGAQAASSHTGALAGSDLAYETAFRQCGVIRAKNMTELFDLAAAFSKCSLPAGDKVAIITNSGGPGIIATDNVESNGLRMARFQKETLEVLRSGLPPESGIYNPVDVLGDAKTDRYSFALEKVCADPNTDVVMLLLCHAATTEPIETGRALIEMKETYPDKTFFASYMGGEGLKEGATLLAENGVPCYTFPEPAISSVNHMVKYRRYIDSPPDESGLDYQDVDKKAVKAIFYDVLKDNRLVLLGSEAAEVARAYGIPAAPVALATTPDEAVEEAEKIGYPVVLKVASPKILHKTDVGGVKVGLDSPEAVRKGFLEIMESVHRFMPQAVVYGVEVNKMMPRGTELIIGMTKDIQFGPMIACGLGGIYVNLLKDVAFRLARGLTRKEIESMLAETKSYSLLRGYRGSEPQDINAVVDAVGRVARLALDFPEITELDVNPVFVYPSGLSALDVKITISIS